MLRKARRLTDEDDDALVWEKLTRTTLDGIGVTPLGTPDQLDGLRPPGAPPAPATGTSAPTSASRREGGQRGGAGRPRERRHLAVAGLDPDADLDDAARRRPARPGAGGAGRADRPARRRRAAFLAHADGHRRCTRPPTSASRPRTASAEAASLAGGAGCSGFVVDATDGARPGRLRRAGARALDAGRGDVPPDASPTPASPSTTRPRWWSSGTPPPTSSSRRSPSCGPPAGCGRGCWSSAAPAPAEQRQHAVTSRPMMSKYDPWVNMLRTTVAAFAAGVGGADAVTVLPFDSPLGVPDAFGRRIARNTSSLLHLRVARRPGRRPGRRRVRRREAHRRPGRRRVGAVRPARGGRGPRRR